MISLEQIRTEMQNRLSIDKDLHHVEVNAPTIDEALADAAVQLAIKAEMLEYEVIEKGSDGFLGIGKKPWKIKIYQNPDTVVKKTHNADGTASGGDGSLEENKVVDKDGLFYVRHFSSSIKLKVIPPSGNGRPVDERDVLDMIRRPDTEQFDAELIHKLIKNGTDGKYETVGKYTHIAAADAIVAVEISKDELHGFITVDPPAQSGADLTADQIERALKAQGILAGISMDKINEFVDNPVYNTQVEVASAIMPEDGKDSHLDYKFITDETKLGAVQDESGIIDYKKNNKIQNVVEGQTLAVKVLATRGKGGKTLFGRYIEAKNGKDLPVVLGQNTQFDKDGVTVVATKNGQVHLVNGKITVEPVLNLDAVNIKSGNIDFLGTVYIKGNVEDGFDVKASGDIDIGGTVGKSKIQADGNIIIHQGVFGKNEGFIKSGKSLWVKFVQEMSIDVEENLIASDSLMNCNITAMKNIVVHGKKAQITGGKLFATEEICARTLGSPGGGATTTLTVGVEPRAKLRLDELLEQQSKISQELEGLQLERDNLDGIKNTRRKLPTEKEERLNQDNQRKGELIDENKTVSDEINEIQMRLRELKAIGKVKVEGITYPGTKIYVRDALDEVQTEVSSCTFYYEGSMARRGKYEPPQIDAMKGPEGYN